MGLFSHVQSQWALAPKNVVFVLLQKTAGSLICVKKKEYMFWETRHVHSQHHRVSGCK